MTNVFIIHGAYGNPEENWFPWLKLELEKLNCKVFVPKFPTPENQTLENWINVFKDYEQYLDKDSIIIGHSLGVPFLLSIIERLKKSIKAAFFVAGFASKIGIGRFDEINKSFIEKEFNWNNIKINCNHFYIFHSDNDPYVPLEKGKELEKYLKAKLILVKNAGHFSKSTANYTQFPLLLEKIKKEL